MVVEILCTCDDLPAHSHVWKTVIEDGTLRRVRDEFDVLITVDWKALARELALRLDDEIKAAELYDTTKPD